MKRFILRRPLWLSAENIDSVVLRRCLEGLCEVIDPVASVQDKEVVVGQPQSPP